MELSPEQQVAAFAESKNVLCLAGAGSGKTRVLISRIENLIENCHVSPYEVLCATFTRKAGGEMRERLEKSIGDKAFNVTIGTLHSVALKMIRRFGEFIGLKPNKITIYSAWEESILLKDVGVEMGYHTGKTWKGIKKKEIDASFHLFYTQKKRREHDYAQNEIMDAFFARCRENNALTYGMIMTDFLDLIPRIAKMLRFRHVLIDEVQDLDPIQWRIIRLICSVCDASLFMVGDDSQSIYSFRGADPGYIIRNQEKFDIFKLRDNYRSDAYIVESANRLIKHNVNRLDLEMNPIKSGIEPVAIGRDFNSQNLCDATKDCINRGYEGNIAVLGRNHYLLEKLSALLSEAGIDHEYIGKMTAFTRSENFRRVHAFLNLAVNPFDNFSFLLCKDYFGIDVESYKKIRLQAVKEDKSHFQVWRQLCGSLMKPWPTYLEAIDAEMFEAVLGCLLHVEFEFDASPVFDFIDAYVSVTNEPKIRDYLDWLALYDVQDEITEEPKKLQLMTIHASKGLEWNMVIIAGMNEGILPSNKAFRDPDELEGERRLAYVAFTRAKDNLILTSRPLDLEQKVLQPPSRFIKEAFGVDNV